jgi:hypothetical protein
MQDNRTECKVGKGPVGRHDELRLLRSREGVHKYNPNTYRSGDTSLNSSRFSGFTWERNEAVRTNCPTELEKLYAQVEDMRRHVHSIKVCIMYPARNALKG